MSPLVCGHPCLCFSDFVEQTESLPLTEYVAQKEEIANTIKANYEKILNTERTLKTQVKICLLSQGLVCSESV